MRATLWAAAWGGCFAVGAVSGAVVFVLLVLVIPYNLATVLIDAGHWYLVPIPE